MSDVSVDWPSYLNDFHAADPGVTEAVLSRAVSGDRTPYRWLCRAVSAGPKRVLDVACGNGAVARRALDLPEPPRHAAPRPPAG
jgi:hypothetical protein